MVKTPGKNNSLDLLSYSVLSLSIMVAYRTMHLLHLSPSIYSLSAISRNIFNLLKWSCSLSPILPSSFPFPIRYPDPMTYPLVGWLIIEGFHQGVPGLNPSVPYLDLLFTAISQSTIE